MRFATVAVGKLGHHAVTQFVSATRQTRPNSQAGLAIAGRSAGAPTLGKIDQSSDILRGP